MAEVSEKAFPFDAEEINGEYDRTYLADDFARYFRSFISSGVFMGESTNLQVIANGDMTVTLKVGAGIIDGYRYDNIEDIIIKLTPADGVLSRIDRISFTWSKEDRDIHYTVQEGGLSYNPVAPECRRTADYKDYVVADVYVGAGVVSISQTVITDQRFNNDVCGLANPFDEVDTTTLYNKLEAFYKEFEDRTEQWTAEQKAIVEKWYEGVKNTLDGDAAVNLQNQIGVLSSLTTVNKSNLVAALNEVNAKEVDVLDTKEEIEANTSDGKVAGAKAVKDIYSSFAYDDNGIYGYHRKVDGADTVIPFNGNKQSKTVSFTTTSSDKNNGYKNLVVTFDDLIKVQSYTIDNFVDNFRIASIINGTVSGNTVNLKIRTADDGRNVSCTITAYGS